MADYDLKSLLEYATNIMCVDEGNVEKFYNFKKQQHLRAAYDETVDYISFLAQEKVGKKKQQD